MAAKPRHHEIELKTVQDFLSDTEITVANSSRENKRLVACFNGNLKVTIAGNIVWQGMQAYSAVEAYNNITEKYISPTKDFKL